ncbi:unnamed protein product [Eruca vesicaria subsp. sativa]|uniref:CRAL-TRIO domain-containing protein n=1 Tax=Eruca vesicaria subsp. sativa TaxID=29727 RepID=A0ABC8L8B4_ERUVS|nr:unnamed protein product [Eruca vesicaria subsp. sativa]
MDDAVDRLTVGPTRIGLELGHQGQCRRATTEVGVAITSHLLLRYENAKIERCDRISIIPRGQTLSQVVFHRLDDESYMFGRRPQLLHRLQILNDAILHFKEGNKRCSEILKCIQRWAPFKDLIKAMQVMLSRPLLVLTIAEALTDQSEVKQEAPGGTASHASAESESDPQTSQSPSDIRIEDEAPDSVTSQDWLTQLYKELEKQRLSLPESNQRPCLIVRLGLAFLKLPSHERPCFAHAIISQVEHGLLHLLNPENSELTVLVDCEGLSPLRIPMQMLRSCSSVLQDHFPNRLGCLFIIRQRKLEHAPS